MTVKEKQNVILPCRATGFPPPVITWHKNGHLIEDKRKQFKKRNLEIKNIVYDDHGIYTCTAENLLGRVQLSVNVTVNGKYSIEVNEHNITSALGSKQSRSSLTTISQSNKGKLKVKCAPCT